mgnify:CR=1 FL=1
MDIKLAPSSLTECKVGLVALPVTEEDLGKKGASPAFDALDGALGGVLRTIARQEDFTGKAGTKLLVHSHGKIPASHVLLVGLGAAEKADLEALRRAAGTAAKEATRVNAGKLAFAVPGRHGTFDEARAATEGLQLGAYRFDKWKSKKDEEKKELKQAFVTGAGLDKDADARKGLELGLAVAEGICFARDLVNEPAMTMTPTQLARAAQAKLKVPGLTVTVHDRKKIEQLKMGMFLGVAQGSREEPKLIEVKYTPRGARGAKAKPVALVGKAITFDSGGLSLKPADAMVDMKTDMAGSAAVFGAMFAIAHLKPDFPVHAYVGSCENMPSGSAYRPGDILTARNGKTVEITNTDAEGRLVLGDVLTYAVQQSKPRVVIDLATLTGACIVALGMTTVGTWSNEDEWAEKVLAAAKQAGESFWHMPLTEEVKENLKSPVADMKNSGARWGGSISAALFLREFVEGNPWVHLDIAGPSTTDKETGYQSKGGTGVGIRTLVELVRSLEA